MTPPLLPTVRNQLQCVQSEGWRPPSHRSLATPCCPQEEGENTTMASAVGECEAFKAMRRCPLSGLTYISSNVKIQGQWCFVPCRF